MSQPLEDFASLGGGPTKRFFVEMLPRDVELEDAVLDLVDNSVDGAMRLAERRGISPEERYRGLYCELTVSGEAFKIVDNCGGIPDKYLANAFSLGRPFVVEDGTLPTIGMYGIGMKRSIFKFAQTATVISRSPDRIIQVTYSSEWLDPTRDDIWDLQTSTPDSPPGEDGVVIHVPALKEEIARQFAKTSFLSDLQQRLERTFAYVLDRGFRIKLNGQNIRPTLVSLISNEKFRPYAFSGSLNDVTVEVTVGLYRNLTRQEERDEAVEEAGPESQNQGGITVVCNDRVVAWANQTGLTGWGLGRVPKYHSQFRSISGLIVLSALDAKKLPVSTTKRDLDAEAEVYVRARNEAIEGLRQMTGLTNAWKHQEHQLDGFLTSSYLREARAVLGERVASDEARAVRDLPGARRALAFFPKPEKKRDVYRISFSRARKEVERLRDELDMDAETKPSEVGICAWEDTLRRYGIEE